MRDQQIRAALDQHWAASDANDFATEHRIYHEDAVAEYPQSGERIRGRLNIQITRAIQPNKKRYLSGRLQQHSEKCRYWGCRPNLADRECIFARGPAGQLSPLYSRHQGRLPGAIISTL